MGQVTRGYAAAATALLLLSGASSFGKYISEFGSAQGRSAVIETKEELCQAKKMSVTMRNY